MTMIDHRVRNIQTSPARQPRAESHFGIVTVSKKLFVEQSRRFKDTPVVERRTAIRQQYFLLAVELSVIRFTGAAPAILAIGINEMPYLIDDVALVVA